VASGAPNYSLDTLQNLRRELAGCALFFLMGADSFLGLRQWRRAAEIPFLTPLIVASRPGEHLGNIRAALPEGLVLEAASEAGKERGGVEMRKFLLRSPAGQTADFFLLPGLDIPISASEIRTRIHWKAPIGDGLPSERELLPELVLGYIRAHDLYR